jgi:predicted Zn-dependent protease
MEITTRSRRASIVALALCVGLSVRCNRVTDAATWLLVSDAEEDRIGDNLYAEMMADTTEYPEYDDSPELLAYVDSIGRVLVDHQTTRPETEDLQYDFTVIDKDTVVNAFAIPGGHVFVYTGLILAVRNEAELAGVLAHELAHITKRHGIERLLNGKAADFAAGLILGDSSVVKKVVLGLAFLKMSRNDEYEADSCSIEYLISSGYNPNGMRDFLKMLAERSSWRFEPLSTHPEGEKRMEAANDIIRSRATVDTSAALLYRERFKTKQSLLN